jgi:glucokinase
VSDQFIGVDVGGTKIAVAVLESGELSESRIVSTEQASQEALVEQLAVAIEGSMGPQVRAVGIGMPSVIEFATGRILASVNIPLHNIPLRQQLTERMGVPVYVDNDAGCATLAEAYVDGNIVSPLVMFTIGTGVGGGWVLNGRLYRGATTSAAEVGHTIIGRDLEFGNRVPGDPFPQRGSLETLASGRALDRLAARAATQ